MGQDICSHRDMYEIQTHARCSHLSFCSRIKKKFPYTTHKSCLLVKIKVPEELRDKCELIGAFGKHCSGIWFKEQKGKVGLCWKFASPWISGNERRLLLLRQCFSRPKSLPHFLGVGLGSKGFPWAHYAGICGKIFSWLLQSFSPWRSLGSISLGTAGWELLPQAVWAWEKRHNSQPHFYLLLMLVFKHRCCGLRITRSCPCAPTRWSPLVLHFQLSDCNYTN